MKLRLQYPCPACGYLVFEESPGSYDICPICFWEDDDVQLAFPDMAGGANHVSLIEAQQNFSATGVIEARLKSDVRRPTSLDAQDPTWRPLSLEKDIYLHCRSESDHAKWDACKNARPRKLYYWRNGYWLRKEAG